MVDYINDRVATGLLFYLNRNIVARLEIALAIYRLKAKQISKLLNSIRVNLCKASEQQYALTESPDNTTIIRMSTCRGKRYL